jgi:hypothetical protein
MGRAVTDVPALNHPLWPQGAATGQLSDAPSERYLVLPSLTDPRLVVPTRPRRSADRILRALRDRSSIRARAKTVAMSVAGRLNSRTHYLPSPSLFDAVAESLGGTPGDFSIGVHLGPPRANRKPVLAVTDAAGTLVAFAKCGVDALTDQLVGHEAEVLADLAARKARGALAHVVVPELMARGLHAGHEYVVQTPIPTTPRTRDPEVVTAAQTEVAALGRGPFAQSDRLAAIRRDWMVRAESDDDAVVSAFARLATTWCDEAEESGLQWGSWHGDWRATNMATTPAGCSVWDWERFAEGVPLGYDALHLFLTKRLASVRELSALPHDVRENSARLLRRFGVTERHDVHLTTTGYLLELAGRYLDDDQLRAGARLGAVGDWLLPHLHESIPSESSVNGGTGL